MSEDKFGQSMSRLVKSRKIRERLFPALIFALLFIPSAHGQKKWSGHILEKQNQSIPNKPPEAVCNDGSLAYRIGSADNFQRQHYCDGHGGVKQFVNNQYVGFNGKILTQAPEQQTYEPPKQDVPQYWLHPVVIDLGKAVDDSRAKPKSSFRLKLPLASGVSGNRKS